MFRRLRRRNGGGCCGEVPLIFASKNQRNGAWQAVGLPGLVAGGVNPRDGGRVRWYRGAVIVCAGASCVPLRNDNT